MRRGRQGEFAGRNAQPTSRVNANNEPAPYKKGIAPSNGDSIRRHTIADHTALSQALRSYTGKRIFDLTCVTLASPIAIVIGIGCALAIRVTSRGPIFFRQERVGMGGVPFTVIKFRTMLHDPENSNPLFPDSAVITLVGKWLRRLSLDELPQLINVLLGNMSIVGPRPTLAYQVERYSERQRLRLLIRPGLTGLAQIRGRNHLLWTDRIEHDIEYLDSQSLLLDAIIVYKTIFEIAGGTGAGGHFTDDSLAALDE